MAELLKGTGKDETFSLVSDGHWGTYSVARWNGASETVSLKGFNRFYDAVQGGGGYDVLQLLSAGDNALLYADELSPVATSVDVQKRFSGISEIRGGDGRDVIDMTALSGAYGNDLLLKGGAGDDVLWAGRGDDVLVGGTGNDDLRGGAGEDIYLFGMDWGKDTIRDDCGTLVFDNALKRSLAFESLSTGTRIVSGENSVEVSWVVSETDVHFADVAELSSMRLNTIKTFLA